ncbi:Virginiamycin B lyase [Pelomyxa schiedti]|nr:Virginiamycin B lyase [Pelomyxa schiedti]
MLESSLCLQSIIPPNPPEKVSNSPIEAVEGIPKEESCVSLSPLSSPTLGNIMVTSVIISPEESSVVGQVISIPADPSVSKATQVLTDSRTIRDPQKSSPLQSSHPRSASPPAKVSHNSSIAQIAMDVTLSAAKSLLIWSTPTPSTPAPPALTPSSLLKTMPPATHPPQAATRPDLRPAKVSSYPAQPVFIREVASIPCQFPRLVSISKGGSIIIGDESGLSSCNNFSDHPITLRSDFTRSPSGLVGLSDGSFLVSDGNRNQINQISNTGVFISVVAGTGIGGYLDGPAETAQFCLPAMIAVDFACPSGIVIADLWNKAVRYLRAKKVTTIARGFRPFGVAVCCDGSFVVTDPESHCIRKVERTGKVTVLAGMENQKGYCDGPAITAQFNVPRGIAVDHFSGIIYVVDSYNNRIRSISPAGTVRTVVGPEEQHGNIQLFHPQSIALKYHNSHSPWLVVADTKNFRVLVLSKH